MAAAAAYLVSQSGRVQLPSLEDALDDPTQVVVIPSSMAVLEVEGPMLPDQIELDGRPVPVALNAQKTRALLQVDLFRSVGFHRLRLGAQNFFFCSEDAKLRLDGVRQMLTYLMDNGLSWGKQLFFSDNAVVRNAETDFAWLQENGRTLVRVSSEVSRKPFRKATSASRTIVPGRQRPLLGPTIRLLRHDPGLLEEDVPDGPVEVFGRSYSPRKIVASVPSESIATVGNNRLTWLIREVRRLVDATATSPQLPKAARVTLKALNRDLLELLRLQPFAGLINKMTEPAPRCGTEELVDPRYRESYRLFHELTRVMGWSPGLQVQRQYAWVKYSDELFQAFVITVLAEALGATRVGNSLVPHRYEPSFRAGPLELYYDTSPPKEHFRNWRDLSARPADMKPDITLYDRERGKGLLIDAKYRLLRSGGVEPSGLSEAQVYMQSFGVNHIVVAFPGATEALTYVEGGSFRIIEMPVRPSPTLAAYLRNEAVPVLMAAME